MGKSRFETQEMSRKLVLLLWISGISAQECDCSSLGGFCNEQKECQCATGFYQVENETGRQCRQCCKTILLDEKECTCKPMNYSPVDKYIYECAEGKIEAVPNADTFKWQLTNANGEVDDLSKTTTDTPCPFDLPQKWFVHQVTCLKHFTNEDVPTTTLTTT